MDTLSIKRLVPSPHNPRKTASKAELNELAASIKAQGILQPLVVRKVKANGHYEILAGYRRYLAAQIAELDRVPVNIVEATDEQALEIMLVENCQRADVDPLEEAEGYKALLAKGLTVKDISGKVGKSRTYIADRMVLANLISELKGAYRKGNVHLGVLSLLGRLTPEQQRDAFEERLLHNNLDWLKRIINERYFTILAHAPFDTTADGLVEGVGSCTKCTSRTGANNDLFGRVVDNDSCRLHECFQTKINAFLDAKKAALKVKGAFILVSADSRASQTGVLPKGISHGDKGWFPAAKDPVTALVVEANDVRQIGKVMKVSLSAPSSRSTAGLTKQEVKQKEKASEERHELEMTKRIRRLAFKKIWERRGTPKKTVMEMFYTLFVHHVNERMPYDEMKAVCRALEVPMVEKKDKRFGSDARDYAKSFLSWLSEFKNEDLYQMGMLLAVAPDLMVAEWRKNGDQLAVLMKLYGIDVKELRKEILDGDARRKAEKKAERQAEKAA